MGPKNSELFSKLYKSVVQANKQLAREMEEKAYFDANEYRRERRRLAVYREIARRCKISKSEVHGLCIIARDWIQDVKRGKENKAPKTGE